MSIWTESGLHNLLTLPDIKPDVERTDSSKKLDAMDPSDEFLDLPELPEWPGLSDDKDFSKARFGLVPITFSEADLLCSESIEDILPWAQALRDAEPDKQMLERMEPAMQRHPGPVSSTPLTITQAQELFAADCKESVSYVQTAPRPRKARVSPKIYLKRKLLEQGFTANLIFPVENCKGGISSLRALVKCGPFMRRLGLTLEQTASIAKNACAEKTFSKLWLFWTALRTYDIPVEEIVEIASKRNGGDILETLLMHWDALSEKELDLRAKLQVAKGFNAEGMLEFFATRPWQDYLPKVETFST